MISKRTLLILGAGASEPYGLPLGGQLLDSIRGMVFNGVPKTFGFWAAACGFVDEQIVKFADTLLGSSVKSVDRFLARRPEFVAIGKFAIAYEIATRERPEKLKAIENQDDWYSLLWDRLSADANTVNELESGRLKIVTFNYDRSLEYFLFRAAKDTFGVSDEEALTAVNRIEIVHPYGVVNNFGYANSETARTYHSITSPQEVISAAAGINIIPETRSDGAVFQRIQTTMYGWAEHIGFLGFGFDALNTHRLNLIAHTDHEATMGRGGQLQLFASVFGMTAAEARAAKATIAVPNWEWDAADMKTLQFLREKDLLR